MSAPTQPAAGIVMAAGRGARFASATPKVMHHVCGRPMLAYVVATGLAAGLAPLVAVIRPGMDVGAAAVGALTVEQPPGDHGTAYAAEVGLTRIPAAVPTVVVMYGDSPLVRPQTVRGVAAALQAADAAAAICWADVPAPGAFGRVRFDQDGLLVQAVVEAGDASPDDLALTSVNAGPAAFRAAWLRDALPRVTPSGASGERYLTRLVDLAAADGERVAAYRMTDLDETIGCDDAERLAAAEQAMRRRAGA